MNDNTALTTPQLRLLRAADSIVFRFDVRPVEDGGFSVIEASRRADDFYGERTDTIEVQPTSVTVYGKDAGVDPGYRPGRAVGGCWVFTSAKFDAPLATMLSLLKAGDSIRPRWTCNNNSDLVWASGLTVDSIEVMVTRPLKANAYGDRNKVLTFALDTTVRPEGQWRNVKLDRTAGR